MIHLNRRIDPRNKSVIVDLSPCELKLGLEPVEFTLVIPGFERRIAPVTEAELRSMDLVRHIAATQSEVAR